MEMFKVLGHMGDGLENMILGLISSILPSNNSIADKLNQTTKSNYFFQETIKSGHSTFKKLRIFEIYACRNGCCAYIGECADDVCCEVCDSPNDPNENLIIYYFPLRDRIKSLLLSDLKNFMNYPYIRRPPTDDFMEDIYDGSNWKWFNSQMNTARGEVFIGIQFCWDGADMFNFSGKVIWPLSVSILNFPKDLRDKLNIGLHVVAMCSGKIMFSYVSL